jgi:Tfp pilus assembly protein PilF
MLDEGVANMQKALDIDPEYDEAMAYMNLLIRYRADLDNSPEEFKKDWDSADNWVQKALSTKKIKNERLPKSSGGITNDVLK